MVEMDDETSARVAALAKRFGITPGEVVVLAVRRLARGALPGSDWSRGDEATVRALAERMGLTPLEVVILAIRRLKQHH